MKRRCIFRLLASSAFAVALTTGSANAVVFDGGVTSGPGVFQELVIPFTESDPDNTVGNDNFQSPNLFAFNEDQNILLGSELKVDFGTNVSAGQVVASHYIAFDPANLTRITGFVEFDAPIIGIASSVANLIASDILQNNAVTYLSPTLRGLESNDQVSINAGNPNRVDINWQAGTPGDYVRVFTQFSPSAVVIPLPAALPLLGSALGFIGFLGWRRRKTSAV